MKEMLTKLLDPMKNAREQYEKEKRVEQFKKKRLLTRRKK